MILSYQSNFFLTCVSPKYPSILYYSNQRQCSYMQYPPHPPSLFPTFQSHPIILSHLDASFPCWTVHPNPHPTLGKRCRLVVCVLFAWSIFLHWFFFLCHMLVPIQGYLDHSISWYVLAWCILGHLCLVWGVWGFLLYDPIVCVKKWNKSVSYKTQHFN